MVRNGCSQLRIVFWVQKRLKLRSHGNTLSVPFLDIRMVHMIPYRTRDMECHSLSLSACIAGVRLGRGMNCAEALLHRFGILRPSVGLGEGLSKGLENLSAGPLSKLFKASPLIGLFAGTRDMECYSLSLSACIAGVRLGRGMNCAEALLHRFGILRPGVGLGEGLSKGLENLSAGPLSKLFKASPLIGLFAGSLSIKQPGFFRYWTPTIKRLIGEPSYAESEKEYELKSLLRRLVGRFCEHHSKWRQYVSSIAGNFLLSCL
ncbi:hypothetical protein RHSIM_Rhsim07G0149200 [Rhododendron simsii]|uniref:Uncharacterized protein n=1 Tax=Rhododendron simsii TaxID=118357 RepID=A0A834LG91_RHOSS|nr:hypothetical protein RHSIM_Rhsim07G0149200 [Rhododendron simsii]